MLAFLRTISLRKFAVFFLAIAISPLCFSLNLNLKTGESFVLKIKIDDKTEIGEGIATSEIGVFSEYIFKLKVEKAENGIYVLSSRLLSAKVRNATPNGIREFDTEKANSLKEGFLFGYFKALKEIPVKTYLDASNCKVLKIEGLEKVFKSLFDKYGFGDSEQKSLIKKNLENGLKAVQSGFRSKIFGFQFCGKVFEKGKTFEVSDNVEIMGLSLKQKVKYFVKEIIKNKAILTFETSFSTDKANYKTIGEVKFIYKMQGSGKGETTMNIETGLTENYKLIQMVKGEYSAENLNYSVPFVSKTEYLFTLKKAGN